MPSPMERRGTRHQLNKRTKVRHGSASNLVTGMLRICVHFRLLYCYEGALEYRKDEAPTLKLTPYAK